MQFPLRSFFAPSPILSLAVLLALAACSDPAAPGGTKELVETDRVTGGEVELEAARAVASVQPAETKAGEAAVVSCRLEDEQGNVMSEKAYTVEITPDNGVTMAGVEVTGTVPGEHKILCTFDEAPKVPQLPATWTVTPGGAATVELVLDPEKPGYMIKEEITVSLRTRDAQGNVLDESAALGTLSAAPEEPTKVDGAIIEFKEAGSFTITATVSGTELSGTRTILVDGEGPKVTVTTPERGLTTTGPPVVTVAGTVMDALLDVAWLSFMEQPVEFDKDSGAFSFDADLVYAINRLHLTAADAAGNMGDSARAVMWSDQYYAMNPPKMETDGVPAGLAIVLTQDALDDGDHDPANPNDLATVVEALLGGIDLMSLLGSAPLGEFLNCDYLVTKLQFDDPKASIKLGQGKLTLVLTLHNMKIHMKNSGANKGSVWQCTLNDGSPDGPAWATGPLKFEADKMIVDVSVAFEKTDAGPKAVVTIDNVDFENMWGINIPGISDIIDWAIETFVVIIKPIIAGLINDTFSDLFSAFALNQTFEIPAVGGGEPNKVALSTEITDIQASPESLRLYMDALSAAENIQRPYTVLGVPNYSGCEPTEPLPIDPLKPLLMGLHADLLNQILFAVWDGGTLNTKLDPSALGDFDLEALGIKDLDATLDAHLPLTVNLCGKAAVMQIGDLYMDAKMEFGGQPTHIGMWIQGEIPITLGVLENEDGSKELGFELGALDDVVLEVVLNTGFFEGNDTGVKTLIGQFLLPKLIGGLAGGLASFPLPDIDLGSLAPGLEGASFSLNIEKVEPVGGYIRMLGGLN